MKFGQTAIPTSNSSILGTKRAGRAPLGAKFQWDCPENFWIVRTVFGLSGKFLDCPDSFWIVRTVLGLSGKFLDCPDSFGIVRKVSGLSGQFLDCPDSF